MTMKKQIIVWILRSAILMVLYPLMTVNLVPAESAMAMCFLLFYLLAPVFSVAAGIAAGQAIHSMWFLSVFPSFFFVLGTWFCFDMGELHFLVYALFYLLLALTSMLLSGLAYHTRLKKHQK